MVQQREKDFLRTAQRVVDAAEKKAHNQRKRWFSEAAKKARKLRHDGRAINEIIDTEGGKPWLRRSNTDDLKIRLSSMKMFLKTLLLGLPQLANAREAEPPQNISAATRPKTLHVIPQGRQALHLVLHLLAVQGLH
jgi:hypothetical protein